MTQDPRHEPHPLALLGHELRTPLTAVLGYADAMRSEVFGPLPAPYRDQAALIHTAASHLLALVDLITPTGAAEAGERPLAIERLGAPDIETLLADAVGLMSPRAKDANVALRVSVADMSGTRIRADRVALSQVLFNLIDNAVKFTASSGTITVGVERAGGDLRLTVENGGAAGLPSGGAGQGLGLRLVQTLVKAMGGSFNLDLSISGQARAVVRLPAIPEA